MNARILLLVFVAAGLVAAARAEYSYEEPFTRSSAFDAAGVLTLDNVNGDIEITAWDKNEIQIEGEKSAETDAELKQIELTMDVAPARADIKVRLPKRSGTMSDNIRAAVKFKIMLPASAVVDRVQVVNSGIRIQGMRGGVRAESVNGGIRATGIGGNITLTTVNGGIEAILAAVSPKQVCRFHTVNGAITIRLPEKAGATITADTTNGGISTDLPLSVSKGFVGKHVKGTIGDGQASIRADTVNGGIRIQRS